MLYHAIPRSQGVENGIKRAKQLTGFEYSPLRPMPNNLSYKDPDGKSHYIDSYVKPGTPLKGIGYSSARIVDKHVGFEVSLETYATALENPDSVLYTRCLHGTSGHGVGSYYGIVCSAFVSYVHNLPRQITCRMWPTYPGISKVEMNMEDYPACLQNIELLDVVLNPKQHIATVTDIITDADGIVQGIEVSESTLPNCLCRVFAPDEFKRYWFDYGFEIYRNENIDNIEYYPNPYSYVEGDEDLYDENAIYDIADAEYIFSFMSDYGNKANYALGEPVVISIFDEDIKKICVYDNDDNEEIIPVADGKAIYTPRAAGIYFAEANGEQITWFTFDMKVSTDKEVYKVGEEIKLTYHDALCQKLVSHYYVKNHDRYKKASAVTTDAENEAGKLTIPGIDTPGDYYICVYSESPYAQYGSVEVKILVEE